MALPLCEAFRGSLWPVALVWSAPSGFVRRGALTCLCSLISPSVPAHGPLSGACPGPSPLLCSPLDAPSLSSLALALSPRAPPSPPLWPPLLTGGHPSGPHWRGSLCHLCSWMPGIHLLECASMLPDVGCRIKAKLEFFTSFSHGCFVPSPPQWRGRDLNSIWCRRPGTHGVRPVLHMSPRTSNAGILEPCREEQGHRPQKVPDPALPQQMGPPSTWEGTESRGAGQVITPYMNLTGNSSFTSPPPRPGKLLC